MTTLTTPELDKMFGLSSRHRLVYGGTNLPLTIGLPERCPRTRATADVVDMETGELRPSWCKANLCPYCAWVNTRKIARAVGASDSSVFFTLTQAGDRWPLIQRRMNRLMEFLRRSDYEVQWAWKVECNESRWSDPARHDHHVQGFAHGTRLPSETVIASEAERVGFGLVSQFLVLKHGEKHNPRYLWGKKAHEVHLLNLGHHLEMNGGRLVHASRSFWRFQKEPMPNMRAVLAAVRADFSEREHGLRHRQERGSGDSHADYENASETLL